MPNRWISVFKTFLQIHECKAYLQNGLGCSYVCASDGAQTTLIRKSSLSKDKGMYLTFFFFHRAMHGQADEMVWIFSNRI